MQGSEGIAPEAIGCFVLSSVEMIKCLNFKKVVRSTQGPPNLYQHNILQITLIERTVLCVGGCLL